MRRRLLVCIAAAALAASCDKSPSAPTSNPSAMGSAVSTGAAASNGGASTTTATTQSIAGGSERPITMMDACDPDTFNAAIGPGTCIRSGGTKFDTFIAQLQARQSAGAWDFRPGDTSAKVGQTFVAFNRGGETHTFTEVAAFGGGVVPLLNQLTGNTTVAPECQALEPDDFVPAGGTYRETLDEAGVKKFQCCIHPWMRLEARVAAK